MNLQNNVVNGSQCIKLSPGYPAPREKTIRIKIPANDVENPTSMLSFTKALPSPAPKGAHINDVYIFRVQEVTSGLLGCASTGDSDGGKDKEVLIF